MEHSGYKLYAELFTNCQITSKPMSEGIKEDFWVTSLACSMGRASSYTTGIFFSRTFMGAPTGGGAIPEHDCTPPAGSSSSSIGTATLMGFGLLNYRWVFSTGRFYRVPLPAARQTSNLEDQWLERSNSRHQVPPTPETTRANPSSGRWNYGREIAENFAEFCDFHVTFGFFYMP